MSNNLDCAMKEARPKLEALMFLLEQGKYDIKLTSQVGEPDQFYIRIKSDEEDEGEYYDGEQLIRLAKSEGWNG